MSDFFCLPHELRNMVYDYFWMATPEVEYNTPCWMWEHRADRKEAEGCCIERATASDYIHNQMSKQVTNTVT